ncbi:unnamed protein product [Owenia fusiformis]|uniref:Glycosyltransferase family 92 protein n=1 Tax=Owenia fusiformis TaxID=6347 RepID=A0A8J1U4B6_OWEFU|nr:unnamed protein product [Owenia fusiformis]
MAIKLGRKMRIKWSDVGLGFLVVYISGIILMYVLYRTSQQHVENVSHWRSKNAKMDLNPVENTEDSEEQFIDQSDYKAGLNNFEFIKLDHRTYFLTGYLDTRQDVHYVRVLTILKTTQHIHQPDDRHPIYCYINMANGKVIRMNSTVYEFSENHSNIFGGFFLSCKIPKWSYNLIAKATEVHMSKSKDFEKDLAVAVPLEHFHDGPARHEFGVCVPPIFNIWDKITRQKLVEFLEMTTILGADHFYMYIFRGEETDRIINEDLQCVLESYEEAEKLTLYDWNVPVSKEDIHYYGQLLSIQHCLYSNMFKSKYLAFNDLDEFIVPKTELTWNKMVSSIAIEDNKPPAGYVFKSAIFPPSISRPKGIKPLITMSSIGRTKINPFRTKCIVKPERVYEMGIHHVAKVQEECMIVNVPEETCLVHHFRNCQQDEHEDCSTIQPDDSMSIHKTKLEPKYAIAYLKAVKYCNAVYNDDGKDTVE